MPSPPWSLPGGHRFRSKWSAIRSNPFAVERIRWSCTARRLPAPACCWSSVYCFRIMSLAQSMNKNNDSVCFMVYFSFPLFGVGSSDTGIFVESLCHGLCDKNNRENTWPVHFHDCLSSGVNWLLGKKKTSVTMHRTCFANSSP